MTVTACATPAFYMLERPRTHNLLILKTEWFGDFSLVLKVCGSLGEPLVFSPHWKAEESALQFQWRMATVAATGRMRASGSTRMAGEHSASFPWVLFVSGWPQEGAACCRAGLVPPQLSLSGRAFTDYPRGLTLTWSQIQSNWEQKLATIKSVCLWGWESGVHILAVFLRGQVGLSAALFTSIKIHFTQKDRW